MMLEDPMLPDDERSKATLTMKEKETKQVTLTMKKSDEKDSSEAATDAKMKKKDE